MITITPASGDSKPKKTIDHKAFRINCTRKTISATLLSRLSNPLRQMINADIPISR